jgi:hypothetical protein
MAVAYDTSTRPTPATGGVTFNHAGSASAKGAIVWIVSYSSASTPTDEITGVTYGGTAMTAIFEIAF